MSHCNKRWANEGVKAKRGCVFALVNKHNEDNALTPDKVEGLMHVLIEDLVFDKLIFVELKNETKD